MTVEQKPVLLIVDDESLNIELMAAVFRDEYEILFALNGEKALEIAVSGRPDLILLDVMMPDMDGLEVCRRLKSGPETKGIPIVFVTAQSRPEDEIRCLDAGAVDFITKPVNPAVVCARVNTHLLMKAHILNERQLEETVKIRNMVEQQERSRLSRDLHDGVGQTLQAIRLHLKLMERRNSAETSVCKELAAMSGELDDAAGELREIAHALRPAYLSEVTLPRALERCCNRLRRRGVPIRYELPDEFQLLPHQINDNLFRIAQESLTNAVRHANAGQIVLMLDMVGGMVILCIRDDGSGIPGDAAASGGKGLEIIRERAGLIGATCRIVTDCQGTSVIVEVAVA